MQSPILTGDNRLRQQRFHILDTKCGVFMPEKNTNSVKIEQKCNNKKRRIAIEYFDTDVNLAIEHLAFIMPWYPEYWLIYWKMMGFSTHIGNSFGYLAITDHCNLHICSFYGMLAHFTHEDDTGIVCWVYDAVHKA